MKENDNNAKGSALDNKFDAYHKASDYLDEIGDYKEHPNESQALRLILIDVPNDDEELVKYWQDNLQEADFTEVPLETAQHIVKAIKDLEEAPYNLGRDHLTNIAMSHSLCPIHFIDWAICFDDEQPGCEQIRSIFPHSHDT